MRRPHAPAAPRSPRRGAASLIVVMVLFFIMALAGAYSSRNLIFEQRTSANQYRSTQAIEAAEAGVEWALAMLNGGRIGADCREAGAAANATSFRQRYLQVLNDGRLRPVADPAGIPPVAPTPALQLMAGCVFDGTDWICSCPAQNRPVLATPAGAGPFPAFRVRFSIHDPFVPDIGNPVITKPGLVMVEVNGCTRLDGLGDSCLDFPGSASNQEGRATLRVVVALKPALASLPSAALTVRDSVLGGTLQVVNTDPEAGGLTIQAGGTINTADLSLLSVPGSTSDSFVEEEPLLNDVSPVSLKVAVPPLNPNRVFNWMFGTLPDTYRLQPAAIVTNCNAGNCRQALADLASRNPGRVIWVEGDLLLDSAGDIGTLPDPANPAVAGPVLIVTTGNVITTANARVFGFVYSQSGAWTGTPDIQGAAFVEGALEATAAGRVVFNREVLLHLQQHSGSFVRVPGGWRDFQ